jgi:hypothetical protein
LSLSLIQLLVEVLKHFWCDSFLDLNKFLSEGLDFKLTVMKLSLSLLKLLLVNSLCGLETGDLKVKIFLLVLKMLKLVPLTLNTFGQ